MRWVEVHERARSRGDGRIVVDGVVSDITTRKETELALEAALRKADRIARVDGLTGAYNRRHVTEVLEGELARAGRSGEPVGLLLLDLDHFKRVNDHHGHGGGDEVLRETTRRMQRPPCAATTPSAGGAARSSSSWCPAWPTRRRCAPPRRACDAPSGRRRSPSATSWSS